MRRPVVEMSLANKKVLVVGLGRTGLATVRFLQKRAARITVTDMADERRLAPFLSEIRSADLSLELGYHREETFARSDLVIVSPGVPHTLDPIRLARAKGVQVLGEIELASRFIDEPVIAVTGTNGKTTTTTLIGDLLKASGLKVFVGGNIGTPLIGYVDANERADVVVAELSSFQLDTIETFRPKVAVLLNLSDDHLDRYADVAQYIRAKARIFMNQQADDLAILNGSDPRVSALRAGLKAKTLFFFDALHPEMKSGVGAAIDPEKIVLGNENSDAVIGLSEIRLVGGHNRENMAAACLAATAFGATPATLESALKRFDGLPHRLEPVATRHGIRYFNDSKSTNVDSVMRALASFEAPVVLIMGGRDKGGDFSLLEPAIRRHAKALIVMGEAGDRIMACLGHATAARRATSMEEALSLANQAAASGDIVLLSPGCASFDMYTDYVQRGNVFRAVVKGLR